jgi:hypothetical protein
MLVPGKYKATAMSAKIVENQQTGTFSFVTTIRLDDVENTPEMDNWTCLVQKDGTASQMSYDSLRKAFPFWDGCDPIALAEQITANPGQYQVEAALDYETYNNKQVLKAKYINPVGGGRGMDDTARASFSTRYGSTWRAWAGSTGTAKPTTPPATKPPKPTPPPPKPAGPPAPPKPTTPPTSSEHECWNKFTDENRNLPEAEINAKWWEMVTKATGGKVQDLTPEEWGKVLAVVPDNLPY